MKRMMLLMQFPLLLVAALLWAKPHQPLSPLAGSVSATLAETPEIAGTVASATSEISSPLIPEEKSGVNKKKELISYAMSLLGSPYVYAGVSPNGFDCSGFVTHVFNNFDISLPHSSALQAKEGVHVTREEAKPGDVVIFTGTNPKVRTPGHVGIIISTANENIEFVHSSSVGGVKVSKVEGTGYSRRFLQIRRVL